MSNDVVDWAAARLAENGAGLTVTARTPEGLLVVRSSKGYVFPVAVIGVQNVVNVPDVAPLFAGSNKPSLVVNVPSKTLWSGNAIRYIHAASASFGILGDVARAAFTGDAGSYRNKNMGFFINAIEQHSNVTSVSYVYDCVFEASRWVGQNLTIAVIDAYNMSAEDVRNARNRFGHFDVVTKASSHGSITHQAEAAAKSMGADAVTFRGLMQRLAV